MPESRGRGRRGRADSSAVYGNIRRHCCGIRSDSLPDSRSVRGYNSPKGTEKVSPSFKSPETNPFLNHFIRDELLPCVKLSGWT